MDALRTFFNTPHNLWFVLAALAVIVSPWLVRAPLRRYLDARRIHRAVNALGASVARDISIPDGLDGEARIDYLVTTPRHLLVVLVKRYPGAIFGAERIDLWAQVMRDGSFKFNNPLTELHDLLAIVRAQLPNVPVEGAVLFDQDSVFPKGKPEGVLHVPEIDPARQIPLTEVPENLLRAWRKLSGQQA